MIMESYLLFVACNSDVLEDKNAVFCLALLGLWPAYIYECLWFLISGLT